MKNYVNVRFTKEEAAQIRKLFLVLRENIPQKRANEKDFFGDIMAPAYEWAVFFGNVAKGK